MDRKRSAMLREDRMLAKVARLLGPPLLRIVPQRRWYSTLAMVLSQAPERLKLQQGVLSMWGSLQNLKSNGFSPRTVIDVGAWIGECPGPACLRRPAGDRSSHSSSSLHGG